MRFLQNKVLWLYYMRSICHANSDNPNRSYEKYLDIDFSLRTTWDSDANQLNLA